MFHVPVWIYWSCAGLGTIGLQLTGQWFGGGWDHYTYYYYRTMAVLLVGEGDYMDLWGAENASGPGPGLGY